MTPGNSHGSSYSSQHGALCSICFQPQKKCVCVPLQAGSDGIVRVARSSKGRKGAGVTTVSGLALPQDEIKALAKELKKLCGSGGTLRNGTIEIQGEHRDRILSALKAKGIPAKRAGG